MASVGFSKVKVEFTQMKVETESRQTDDAIDDILRWTIDLSVFYWEQIKDALNIIIDSVDYTEVKVEIESRETDDTIDDT